ncbi:MAG: RHS repeat-associated core domain-containing protein [Odoribacter sp.]|nr:RHS repeat-associated core domain-containing protein [Odoribacter sp.]
MKIILYMMKRQKIFCLSLLLFILQGNFSFAQVFGGDNYVRTRTYINPTSTQSNAGSIEDINYLDGFGRVIQSIAVNAIPTQNRDVITPFEYGVHGRTEKSYLPYVKTGNNGKYDSNWSLVSNWGTYGVEEQAYAFGKIEYDNSPLNRVRKETGAGAAWHTNAKGVVTTYKNNSPNRTYKWQVSSNGDLVNARYYPGNAFIVLDKINEDGIWTQTCVDSEGRVILDILIVDGAYWDTYYVYDMRGNLCYVLPPEASARISSGTISTATLNEYAYYYKYDEWGRMIEKKLPGNAPIYYVYDKYDNLVLTQDGNQRGKGNVWTYMAHDSKNRIKEEGEVTFASSFTRQQLQTTAESSSSYYPTGGTVNVRQKCVYDRYSQSGITFHAFLVESGYESTSNLLVTGELTGKLLYETFRNTQLFETYYYDDKMRLIQVVANNHMGGISRTSMAYDFTGNLVKVKERHTRLGGAEDVLETTFTYDSRGRLLSEKAVLNNAGTMEVAYTYDPHDRILTKTYGNNDYTETFSYNIRSWLTSIEGNLFSQKLRYTNPELGHTPLYSGNISEWDWGQSTVSTYAYGFDYDSAGRLKDASFYEKNGVNWIKNHRFNEQNITYDKHGNIKTLTRTQEANVQTFNYTYSGNRLMSLAGSLAGNYEYDYNGNLIKDSRRGFTLSYNRFDLLDNVKNGNTLVAQYSYRSDGMKQRVRHGTGVHGFDYLGSLTYKANNGVTELEGALTSEGLIVKTGNTYETLYHLQDHLGSVRAIWNATKKVAVEFNDYYPFGKTHERSDHIKSDNRYGYNGKEEQVIGDLGYLDYGARMYDTELGRWLGVDPVAEEYHSFSPYNYVMNNPVLFIDPNGMWVEINGGYTTTSSSDITRFLDALAIGSNFGSSSVSMDWMNNFVETEMKGLGELGEDHWLLSEVGLVREKNTHWTEDWESIYNAWSQVNFILNGHPRGLPDIGHPVLPPLSTTWDKVKDVFSPRTYGMWKVGPNGRITGLTPRGGTAPTPGIKGGISSIKSISGFTSHGVHRAIGDFGRKGVSPSGIMDALKNPVKVGPIKMQGGKPSQRYFGKNGEVVINPNTRKIISVNPMSTKKLRRYTK